MGTDKDWFGGPSAATMEIISLREPSVGDSTAGYVMVNEEFFCHCLEDPVREPKEARPIGNLAELERWVRSWKIPKVTAIPSGRYPVGIDLSTRFKKRMIAVGRVPAYEGILAHGGTTPDHSEGCPLLGDELYKTPAGWRVRDGKSKPAVERLFAVIDEALARGVEVWWTFKPNPNGGIA